MDFLSASFEGYEFNKKPLEISRSYFSVAPWDGLEPRPQRLSSLANLKKTPCQEKAGKSSKAFFLTFSTTYSL
jgi:hypothetical protein